MLASLLLFGGDALRPSSRALAGELVIVRLKDGSRRIGEIDLQTNAGELWLYSAEPSIVVRSAVPWSAVQSADVGGKIVDAEELRGIADRQKSPIPPVFEPELIPMLPEQLPLQPQVQSLEILPSLANWDRDAETDGLEIRLSPLTRDRRVAAVDGLVTVRLYGRRVASRERLESASPFGFWTNGGTVREYAVGPRDVRYVELGRWTKRIRAAEFDDLGVTARMPFRTIFPEQDLDLALDGLVDAALRVNGQNIYRATAPIQLRTFSPYRDELQLNRGTRFLPRD